MATNEVARTEQVKHLATLIDQYAGRLERVMPKHTNAEAFIELGLSYVKRDEKLLAATQRNPQSLILALRECASLGHMPTPKHYALVVFNNKRAMGGVEVVGIETYQGVLQRMFRAGGVQSVHVEVVRENDTARFQRTEMSVPFHRYNEFAPISERGPLVAVYAYAYMLSGAPSYVVWMPRDEVSKHRAASRSGEAFWGPEWPAEGPWTPDMWKKTALHKLEDMVPSSAEYRWEVAQAGAAASRVDPPHMPVGGPEQSGPTSDVQDAEVVSDDGVDWPPVAQPKKDGEPNV